MAHNLTTREEVIGWLTEEKEGARRLIDLKWDVKQVGSLSMVRNENVPFTILLLFTENTVRIFVDTGIETAVLKSTPRLSIYRTLLILNRQAELVKFMLDGINENIFARVDLELLQLTRSEFDDGLNTLLSALYLMVKALKLEEQFNKQIIDRMVATILDLNKEGKSRKDIVNFLVERIGFSEKEAEKMVDEILSDNSGNIEGMYG